MKEIKSKSSGVGFILVDWLVDIFLFSWFFFPLVLKQRLK